MFISNLGKRLAAIIIAAFLFEMIGLPSNAEAQWHSKTKDYPGTSITTVVAIGVASVALLGIVLYARHASKKAREKEIKKMQEERNKEKTGTDTTGYYDTKMNDGAFCNSFNGLFENSKKVSLIPYVGLRSATNFEPTFSKGNLNISNHALVVGLAVNF